LHADVLDPRYGSGAVSVPPDRAGKPSVIRLPGGFGSWGPAVIGAGVGLLTSRAANAAAAREAEKNRQFQAEMSSTAHQREVRDMLAAGINPMLSARGAGASTPGGAVAEVKDVGEGVSRGVASALAIKQLAANVELTRAQAENVRGQTFDLQSQAAAGRYAEIANRVASGDLDLEQRRALLPILLSRAKSEMSSAASAALLDKAMLAGAANAEKFEKQIGAAGPWTRLFFELMRSGGSKFIPGGK